MFTARYFDEAHFPDGHFNRGSVTDTVARFLTLRQLTSLRATMESSFCDTCTIRRRTVAADGQGGETWTWADQGGYRCRLRWQGSVEEPTSEDSINGTTNWVLYLPQLADVQPKDRVTIDNVEYEVTETDRPKTERLCREVRLVRVL